MDAGNSGSKAIVDGPTKGSKRSLYSEDAIVAVNGVRIPIRVFDNSINLITSAARLGIFAAVADPECGGAGSTTTRRR